MVEIIKNPNIDFIGKRKFGFIFSAVLLVVAVLIIFIKGPNFGIDFTGGVLLQIKFDKPISTADLRNSLAKLGTENAMIQSLGAENREYIIRAAEKNPVEFARALKEILAADFPDNKREFLREETVEPKIGKELLVKTLWSIIVALVLILIYVSFRFDYRFGTAAVIALFHDAIITIGVLVLTQKEFSIVIVGALLTIIGYSINDSIVISDRIREKYKKMRKEPYNTVLNTGLNEVLSRTVLTVGTTLLAVLALLIFGGAVIADFAFTLLVGFLIGTYSSIFIVANIVSVWEEKFPKKKK
ncbi:MAG TPA: protein translocase subunit SecF [candidate division WOR-3 bacterium]|uniref:Protein-export membrane protein SecF n=1 Tax=candidate division WOR-3 bacterium TaxID=2052148 RepID=A0A9C9ELM5_UNCW3|nr:protein translocase subunit SecF [candidate division WOR-3 bacterium]